MAIAQDEPKGWVGRVLGFDSAYAELGDRIEEVRDANDDVTEALNVSCHNLRRPERPWIATRVERLVTSETTRLFVARNDAGHIVGMLTLVVFFIPSGMRARIKDVVVDSSARGQGHGDALTRAALELI
jgi:ribosomal protein S18 acetylase RimI-like enzyme